MEIIVIDTGKFLKILSRDDDRHAAAADHFRNLRCQYGTHQNDPRNLALLHDLNIAKFCFLIMVCTAQKSHIALLKQTLGCAGCYLADRLGIQSGYNDPDLIDPSCPHGLGHRVRPVAGLLNGFSDPLTLLRAYGSSVQKPADCSRGYPCEPGNFFNGHL